MMVFLLITLCKTKILWSAGMEQKGFGLIQRFSEDVDITVFREDIGEDASVEALETMSGKKRQAKLDDIKAACQAFILGDLLAQLSAALANAVGEGAEGAKVDDRLSSTST